MRNKILLSLVLGLNLTLAHSLEIDEKLTLRFLKVSGSKKTVLINRGGEDGLVVGDHAKFFITAGVVARGIAEKVSPSRSIWSLYRVVDPNEITEDKVLNLKIATPVKITEDASKSMKEEVIPGGTESMSMNDDTKSDSTTDASNKEIVVDDADQAELDSMGMDSDDVEVKSSKPSVKTKTPAPTSETLDYPRSIGGTNKNDVWEVWGLMYVNSLSGTSESGTTSTESSSSTFDFSGGIERYFHNSNGFFKDVSLNLFLHKRSTETGSDVTVTSDWTEYGLGVNYHFYNHSYDLNRPVLFGAFTFGKGSSTHESRISSGTTQPVTEEGDSTFFSLGVGTKYLLGNGFGARAILDYYSSTETYTFSDETESERTLSGPRIQFGISYRF